MQLRFGGHWPKALWKVVKNPTIEVIAAIVLVLLAAWVVVQAEADLRTTPFPLFFYGAR